MKRSKTKKIIPAESLSKLGEFGLINLLKDKLAPHNAEVLKGIGDDAAILRPKGGTDWVLTTDMLVEGRHFDLKSTTPWELGAKTIAVNISDCAAMGAKPKIAVISIGIPKDFPPAAVQSFYDGLKGWAGNFGVDIVGGDTVGAGELVVNVALLGEVEKGRALTRSGSKLGDAILVTGSLGDSAAGLHSLKHPGAKGAGVRPLLEKRHKTPVPRMISGRFLVESRLATSCIDISDGLSSEIHHLAEESGLGAEIHSEGLPISQSLGYYAEEMGLDPLELALHGGEDYELLFTVPLPNLGEVLRSMPGQTGVPVKSIGRMTSKSSGVTLIGAKGVRKPLKAKGYDHFK